jgi:DNA (cytosine-5)-methyltransferase 1
VKKASEALTFIDLFCGCGGFSLGMERAGFECVAALDFNTKAVATFRANFPDVPHVLERDLTKFRPAELEKLIAAKQVDVIAGGPPCQGFSIARQRDGANHGALRLIKDDRRQLYRDFLKFVGHFRPRVFVMENVLGIQSAAGGEYFTRVQHEARLLGYRVVAQIADAFALGLPQKRRRQLIVGVRGDLPGFFPTQLTPAPRALVGTTLGPAICDLPRLEAGGGVESAGYDFSRRARHLAYWRKPARNYLYRVCEVTCASKLTAHRARPHSARDLGDFFLLREGENSAIAMREGVEFAYPYDKNKFKDRYTRQSRRKPCSTIVAHLSKDGLMFIHPTQNRSLTPREAARIQSFPDWFEFPVARTHQFRVIGNAVPPLVSEALGLEVRAFLAANTAKKQGPNSHEHPPSSEGDHLIPPSQAEASVRLQAIARLDRRQLRACEKPIFLRGWFALFYLFPGLHPDNALDHGDPAALWSTDQFALPGLQDFATHRFARSGWPVALELLGREAWRRYASYELEDNEFYCADAQRLGLVASCKRLQHVDRTTACDKPRRQKHGIR